MLPRKRWCFNILNVIPEAWVPLTNVSEDAKSVLTDVFWPGIFVFLKTLNMFRMVCDTSTIS